MGRPGVGGGGKEGAGPSPKEQCRF
jgi:hypothetical protein